MESSFDIIWLVAVIVFSLFKFIKRASAKSGSSEPEQEAADSAQAQQPLQEAQPGAPVFAYYYTGEGQKKVDVGKSRQLSGRDITEYEIYSEQQRLDKLWAAELERQEQQDMEAREAVYAAAEPAETPDMEALMDCARSGAAEHIGAEPVQTHSSDRDYQLAQLERWLEAGLIDKDEYKKRKRELE